MIVVTGGAGFIGSALIWFLKQQGHEDILAVDHLDRSEKFRNLCGLPISDYLERDLFQERIEREDSRLPKIEAVFHLGACSSTAEEDGSYLMYNNFEYSKTLAQWCLAKEVRFIYASSAATYGDGAQGYSDSLEVVPKLRPLNRYALSKQLFDQWALAVKAFPRIAGVKYFNVYGPNEYHKGNMRSVVLRAFEQIQSDGCVRLFRSYRPEYADGEQVRDFVYVKDAVAMTAWLLEHREQGGLFNVGAGRARSWNDLARAVFSALGQPPRVEYVDMPEALRAAYQYHTCADMSRWAAHPSAPKPVSLEEGVRDYVTTYLARGTRYLAG